MPAEVYQLKVSLADARPPLWRRVLVASDTTLADLHRVMQALMGWEGGHLHEWEVPLTDADKTPAGASRRRDVRRYGPSLAELVPDWMREEGPEDESAVLLAAVAPNVKSRFSYIYDMGDNWDHSVLVEKILPFDPNGVYPVCLTGKRSGPIEDCGGMWGYEELLEILADPAHPDHDERKEWLEDVYGVPTWDGDHFDLPEINERLRPLRSD